LATFSQYQKNYVLSIILFKKLMIRWGNLLVCGSQASLYATSWYVKCKKIINTKFQLRVKFLYLYFIYSYTAEYANVFWLNIREAFFSNIINFTWFIKKLQKLKRLLKISNCIFIVYKSLSVSIKFFCFKLLLHPCQIEFSC